MSSEKVESVYGLMPSQLSCASLKDLCVVAGIQTGPFGSQLHQEDYVQLGTPIITVEHLGDNRIVHANLPQVSDEDKARLSKYMLKTGDIVFSRVGSVDRRALVQPAEDGWLFSGRCLRVRSNPDKLDAQWLSYFFGLPAFKNYIRGIAVGATMPSLNTKILSDIPVYYPDLDTQKAAAEVLAKIDDRLTLLRETNTTLEAIAQALFKSWFVDFDPIHAKMHGRAPEGMDDATAALFPDSFEDSELGPVPKGWTISSVADVAEIVKGKSYSSKDLVDRHTTALVTLKSFERGGGFRMDGFKPYSGSFKPTQVVIPGDLIIAYTDVTQAAELIGKPAIVVGVDEHDTLVASLDVGIVRPDFSVIGRQFLYGLFKTDSFQSHTLAHTSGTTVLHLAKDGVGSYQFARPSVGLINVFEGIATKLAERRQINSDQVRLLTSLRDTLLPRLISGQLNIKEIENTI
jgi:type I restriction enzyme S subunit